MVHNKHPFTAEAEARLKAYFHGGEDRLLVAALYTMQPTSTMYTWLVSKLFDEVPPFKIPGYEPSLYSRWMKKFGALLQDEEFLMGVELPKPAYPDPEPMMEMAKDVASLSLPCVALRLRAPDYFIVDLYTCSPTERDPWLLEQVVIKYRYENGRYLRAGSVTRVDCGTDTCGSAEVPIFDPAQWVFDSVTNVTPNYRPL